MILLSGIHMVKDVEQETNHHHLIQLEIQQEGEAQIDHEK